jgi:hypothetical protein
MRKRYVLRNVVLFFTCLFFYLIAYTQKVWTGNGGDGNWSNALNWNNATIPLPIEDVLLDNSVVTISYQVMLPLSNAVSVKSITIAPAGPNTIELILPSANTQIPAFNATGPGYGILLNAGGIFRNSAAVSSGINIVVADSFRINNGGTYIHNTRASHAGNISQVLSRMPGTENGSFEFDVPGGAYTTSITNRIYGNLILSATASGGSQSYNSIAANPCLIRGDLQINDGVIFNIDLTNTFTINRHLLMQNSMLNLASQPNNNRYIIHGNIVASAGSIITETSSGSPTLELAGTQPQQINIQGSIINDVNFTINGFAASLQASLQLPHKLKLIKGILHTSDASLLILLPGCGIEYDSLSNNSFIEGPLRKEGLSVTDHFLFPIGKDYTQRWLALKNVTGNFTVNFNKDNPRLLSNIYGAGINHISGIEYWSIQADASPSSIAQVELSFDNVNSGGVTDISTLRAAQLYDGTWKDIGNTATTGSAGASGSVVSVAVSISGPGLAYFTLGSTVEAQNPLPLEILSFTGRRDREQIFLEWKISDSFLPDFFEVQASPDGKDFKVVSTLKNVGGITNYKFMQQDYGSTDKFYRLRIIRRDGTETFSNSILLSAGNIALQLVSFKYFNYAGIADIKIVTDKPGKVLVCIKDFSGRIVKMKPYDLHIGLNNLQWLTGMLPKGYLLFQLWGNGLLETRQFLH